MIGYKFFQAQFVLVFFIIVSYLGLIFIPVDYDSIGMLSDIVYHDFAFYTLDIEIQPTVYTFFKATIAIGLVGFAFIIAYAFITRNGIHQQLVSLFHECILIAGKIFNPIKRLSLNEKLLAGGLFIGIIGTRLWFLFFAPFHPDEIATYDFFVRNGPHAVAGYYPIPNNHIFFSFVAWVFSLISENMHFVLRLPVFLIGLFGSVLLFIFLLRYAGFLVATLAIFSFFFSEMGIYYSFAGRGYFFLMLFSAFSFFFVLELIQHSEHRRVCWFVFIVSSILGFYTVPVFLYSAVSLGIVVMFYVLRQKNYALLKELTTSVAIIGFAVIILYMPVILISGLKSLVGNPYVISVSFIEYLQSFPGYFQHIQWELIGRKHGFPIFLATVFIAVFLLLRKELSPGSHKLLFSALVMVILSYVLMTIQTVFPPGRALFYKSFYFFVAFSIVLVFFLEILKVKTLYKRIIVCVIVLSYGFYNLNLKLSQLSKDIQSEEKLKNAYALVMEHEPEKVFIKSVFHEFYFLHYSSHGNKDVQLDGDIDENLAYDFILIEPGMDFPMEYSPKEYEIILENEQIRIFKRKS
ncbi:MAG: hypothetical protein ACK4ND_12260 [Cytophagaceae bacterium]